MAIIDKLRQSGGISALARQLGESPAVTMQAVDALLPELLDDFQNYSGGLSNLLELIGEAGGGAMAQAIMDYDPVDTRPGHLILRRVHRLESVSTKETGAAGEVVEGLRQRLLPMMAMLLGGYLSARATSGGLDMQELARLLVARKQFRSPGEEQV